MQGGYLGKAQAWTGRVTNNLAGQAGNIKEKLAGGNNPAVCSVLILPLMALLLLCITCRLHADIHLIFRHLALLVLLEQQTKATQQAQALAWEAPQTPTTQATQEVPP